MKKKFIIPEMEILLFNENESITMSGNNDENNSENSIRTQGLETSVDMAGGYLEQNGASNADITVRQANSIF